MICLRYGIDSLLDQVIVCTERIICTFYMSVYIPRDLVVSRKLQVFFMGRRCDEDCFLKRKVAAAVVLER